MIVKPKLLILDIEWKPTTAFVWRAWDENVGPAQILEHGGLLCVGYKWKGERHTHVLSEWEHGHEEMVRLTHEILHEAEGVITYNGDKYDIPKLRGEFLLAGLKDIPPVTSIDLIKTVKKLGFFMNRLGFIGPFLGLGGKVEHEGIGLWKKVMNGDERAQRRMERYCKQDVKLTERLYNKTFPYIRNHPNFQFQEAGACGACGSTHVQKRGPRRTKYYVIQRLQCQDCGSWSDGTRKRVE